MNETTEDARVDEPRFQFVRELGRGVLGEAYEVLDETTGEPVVLKIFVRSRPINTEEFRLEFQSLARLSHPNLVRFYHLVDPRSDTNVAIQKKIGEDGLAFTQQYVDGNDLYAYLATPATAEELDTIDARKQRTGEIPSGEISGELPSMEFPAPDSGEISSVEIAAAPPVESPITSETGPQTERMVDSELSGPISDSLSLKDAEDVLAEFTSVTDGPILDLVFLRLERIVPQIVAGLEHLHKFHKVHGNLRPTNILVSRDGTVKLTDYGLIPSLEYRRANADDASIPLLHAPENLPYLAPEIIDSAASPQSDLYALGCVLYHAISGESPHDHMEWSSDGDTPTLEPPPLADYVKECPSALANTIDGLLRRDPTERPALRRVQEVISGDEARPVMVPAAAVPEPTTFVGREEIVDELKGLALDAAEDRQMTLVQLEGETGIGKSQILSRVSHWLARRGWLVLKGECYDRESLVYQGWHDVAVEVARLVDSLPSGLQEELRGERIAASRLFPELAPVLPVEPGGDRLSSIAAFRRLIARVSEQRPILVILNNLQWASWDTASLLIDLFSETEDIRCLVVGTWQSDTERARDHLLQTDVELALLDIERVHVRGYDAPEAGEYARMSGATLNPAHIQAHLKRQHVNPLLLRELCHENKNLDEAVEALVEGYGERLPSSLDLMENIFQRRLASFGLREKAILGVVSVASLAVPNDLLCEAVETELASTVLPAEGSEAAIERAIDELVDSRMLRQVFDEGIIHYEPAQLACRRAVLSELSDRDKARLAGRLADAIGVHAHQETSLRFEYELRAGRIARAMDSAVEAAERAEVRFAYHRAAKLWRWILEHEETLPEYSMLRPTSELARVEHLAGQHAEAANLYEQWAEDAKDPVLESHVRLKQASAWLQAGDVARAESSLDAALRIYGESYGVGVFQGIRDLPARLIAFSTSYGTGPNSRMPEIEKADATERQLAEIYFFAIDHNDVLQSTYGAHFDAQLCRLAERSGDAGLLGMARLKAAQIQVQSTGHLRERGVEWLADAHEFFDATQDEGWSARAWVDEGLVRYQMGEFGKALKAFDIAEQRTRSDQGSHDGFDHRGLLVGRSRTLLAVGQLDAAAQTVGRLLHVHRGDRFAAFHGYLLLAEEAILGGGTARAEQLLVAASEQMQWAGPSSARVRLAVLQTQVHLAQGRPEVAVGLLDVFCDDPETRSLMDETWSGSRIRLALGQALCAESARQAFLGVGRASDTLGRARKVLRALESQLEKMDPVTHAAVFRLRARVELLRGRPKKAMKELECAVDVLSNISSPLEIARSTEAKGIVMAANEKPEGRNFVEQAYEMYRVHGLSYPLVLEGWPVPRELASLKED